MIIILLIIDILIVLFGKKIIITIKLLKDILTILALLIVSYMN